MDFASKYRDARWQRKRNAILERDDYTCTSCYADDNRPLEVHHLLYLPECEPWDYEEGLLEARCRPCHQEATDQRRRLLRRVSHFKGSQEAQTLRQLNGFVAARYLATEFPERGVRIRKGEELGFAAFATATLRACEAVVGMEARDIDAWALADLPDAGMLADILHNRYEARAEDAHSSSGDLRLVALVPEETT